PNQQFPSVDGKRSMQVYLMRMREALEDFEMQRETHPDDFALVPFHTPFPGMVRKAAALGYRHVARNTDVEEELAEEIGRQPRPEAFDDEEAYRDALKEYTDKLTETDLYGEWYSRTIEPTLEISAQVGNWYTGSVHVARIAGLKHARENGLDLDDEQLLVCSYGSGAQAEIHAETVQPGWEEEIAALTVDDQLVERYDITWDQYEQIHDVHNHDETTDIDAFTTPEAEFAFDGWGRMGERKYTYVE
ncbi:MAG: hydroxymethylglutaryl-CoA synthase, partial [Halapricum sp.]